MRRLSSAYSISFSWPTRPLPDRIHPGDYTAAVAELKLHEGDRFPVELLGRPLMRRTVVFFYPAALTGG